MDPDLIGFGSTRRALVYTHQVYSYTWVSLPAVQVKVRETINICHSAIALAMPKE